MDPGLIALGVVAGAHGVGGEIRVHPFNPESATLENARQIWLRDPRGGERALRVLGVRRHKGFFLMRLEGIADRDAAIGARGQEVLVPKAALAPLEEDEFYLHELVGMTVRLEDGRTLGVVSEVFETA